MSEYCIVIPALAGLGRSRRLLERRRHSREQPAPDDRVAVEAEALLVEQVGRESQAGAARGGEVALLHPGVEPRHA